MTHGEMGPRAPACGDGLATRVCGGCDACASTGEKPKGRTRVRTQGDPGARVAVTVPAQQRPARWPQAVAELPGTCLAVRSRRPLLLADLW